jgi:hypothetical protein
MAYKGGKNNVLTGVPSVGGTKIVPLRTVNVKSSAGKAEISREAIARRAYELWVKHGCHHGWDQQHWLEAEKQLKTELGVP